MTTHRLAELKDHSLKIGSNRDLVQASGGNTSWKEKGFAWVKGSGKRLKDAHSDDIFALVQYKDLAEADVLGREDFSKLVSGEISPSIETNFHILIASSFVTHLHSLSSVAIGVSLGQIDLGDYEKEILFVPYARPGLNLVKEIQRTNGYLEKILILQNHGAIFSGESCNEIEKKIEFFENTIQKHFVKLPVSDTYPDWIEILTSGVLTPDEAVFLGEKPFVKSENSNVDSVMIDSNGNLLFPKGFSSDRIELAQFYVRVAKLIGNKTQVRYLQEIEVRELLSWDKEQIRIAMAE
jgi:rhamnose utilization protein RhaD (predicted bifunctional aldolase and dehydrogenase)